MRWLLILGLTAYRRYLSPQFGGGCRFTPSCSQYALESVRRYGAIVGMRLTLSRLKRCRPAYPCGYDPVPGPDQIRAAVRGELVAGETLSEGA
jgi:putative membrane protein insertion efficiency factor